MSIIESLGARFEEKKQSFTKSIGTVLLVGSSFGIAAVPVEMIVEAISKTPSRVEMVAEEIERQPVDWNYQQLGIHFSISQVP